MNRESINAGIGLYSSIISLEKKDNCLHLRAQASFPLSFCGFQGHFPEKPILPAIVQLGLVRIVGEKALQVKLLPETYEKVKFKSMVVPDERIDIEMNVEIRSTPWQAKFKLWKDDGSTVASGTVRYRVDNN